MSEMIIGADPPEISVAQLEAAETAYDLGIAWDGCPCFTAIVDGQEVEGHCWRACSECRHCGLHAGVITPAIQRLKVLLDKMDWYGEWGMTTSSR